MNVSKQSFYINSIFLISLCLLNLFQEFSTAKLISQPGILELNYKNQYQFASILPATLMGPFTFDIILKIIEESKEEMVMYNSSANKNRAFENDQQTHNQGINLAWIVALFLIMISLSLFGIFYYRLSAKLKQEVNKQKKIADDLWDSEIKFRILTESLKDVIWILDPVTLKFTYVSPSVEHLRGYTAEEVMAKPLDDALTSEGRAKVRELINKGMSQFINGKETQKYFTEVLEQPCKDGSTVWTEVITKYNWNIRTGAVEIYGVTRDITERYRADLEIRKLSAATQQSPASIVITDLDGNIEYVNPKFTRVTGYSLEEIIGKNPRILKSGDKPKSYYNELWNTIKAGKEWRGEFINRKKNGEIYYELGVISPINDSNGTIMNFLAVKEDISERKLAEIALQESEEKFRILVDTTPTGIFIAIGDRLVFANNALSAISTYSIDELKGMWHLEFIHPKYKELTKKRIEALTSGEAASSFEIMIVTKNGYEKWVLVAAASINYGGKSAVIGSMIDISERIAMENQLKEINSTKDRFFSIIAHDLRSPMGSFKGITKLLADSYKDFTEAEITEIINSLKISSESIYNLLENLLEWANTQRGAINYQPTEINLKLLFNSNITLLKQIADNKNISLQNDLRDDFVLFADANLLNTIIRNLVSNAIKFTPKGGSILLNAETNDYGSVISVKDSGVGITADAISKLFKINEIYTTPGTLNEKGSGLGLILSKEFVNRHGGEIWVESEPGKGSTFKFSLPNRPSN